MTARSRARVAVGLGTTALVLLVVNGVLIWNIDAAGSAGSPPAATMWLVGLAGAPIVGMIIAGRRPDNSYGWLLLSFSITSALLELTELYALYALERFGQAGALGIAGGLASQVLWGATIGHIPMLLLLFPDGRLPSPRWRWLRNTVLALTAVCSGFALFMPGELGVIPVVNPLGAESAAGRAIEGLVVGAMVGIFAAMFPATASLLFRRRSASLQRRLQLRWFSWAAALLAAALLGTGYINEDNELAANFALMLALVGLFAAVGIAVLRYRLYDIDRVISRTVSYLVLTLVLGGVYVGAVTALTTATASRASDSPLAVAAATLAAAAAFGPARRRIQHSVDRRFNRARYDAEQAVDEYRTRLRDTLDVEAVTADLLGVVRTTMEPADAQLWLQGHEEQVPG